MVGEELLVLVEGDEACDTCQSLRALTLPEGVRRTDTGLCRVANYVRRAAGIPLSTELRPWQLLSLG